MHVEQRGSGRPLVLVHGWGAGAVTWSQQLESLAGDFRVIAPDLPGFGQTPPLGRSDAAGFSSALRELVDAERLDKVLLAGWSMGGLVVLDYASRFDCHALAALVVVDVALRAHQEAEFGRRAEEWARRWPAERETIVREVTELGFVDAEAHRTVVELLVREAMRADPDAALEAFANLRRCDFRASLPDIDVPILFLFGTASTSTSPHDADAARSLARHPRIVRFDDCGHALMFEDPHRFDSELRAFAATLQ